MTSSFEEFLHKYQLVTFRKGQLMLLKGDAPDVAYVIEYGSVSSFAITPDGAERQISLHFAGDDIPVGLALGLKNQADFFYKAYTDCLVRVVPCDAFVKMLRQDPDTLMQCYLLMCKKLVASLGRISALEHPRAGDKVAFMLMNMAEQFGTKLRPHATQLRLSVTQQQMADAVGLTRETTGIELRKLEINKIISHSRKNYVLYMERLREYIDSR